MSVIFLKSETNIKNYQVIKEQANTYSYACVCIIFFLKKIHDLKIFERQEV